MSSDTKFLFCYDYFLNVLEHQQKEKMYKELLGLLPSINQTLISKKLFVDDIEKHLHNEYKCFLEASKWIQKEDMDIIRKEITNKRTLQIFNQMISHHFHSTI
jgi:hypothetical protein